MEYQDKYIECVDCGQEFVHSADDQARYSARGLKNDPKRCPQCRQAKRADQKARGRQGRGGGGDRGGKRREGDGRSQNDENRAGQVIPRSERPAAAGVEPSPAPEGVTKVERTEINWPDPDKYVYTVTCAECGQETTVPFRPTDDPPVYCRSCFLAKLPSA